VFLYEQSSGDGYYDFVPYRFGAYSFQLAQDVDVLRQNGYLTDTNKLAQPYTTTVFVDMCLVSQLRGDALIKFAYERYPYYAINSTITKRIFGNADVASIQSEKQKLVTDVEILFSIGYEGKSIEQFANVLLQNGVKLLCDVRRNPLSRKFGFSGSKLQHILDEVGIGYAHVPELGIASENRQELNTLDDYNQLFTRYEQTLPSKTAAVKQVYDLLKTNKRIALMCFERDPNYCHRTRIKNFITASYIVESEDL
jgi:uncharacterized protein (DUF488 family)